MYYLNTPDIFQLSFEQTRETSPTPETEVDGMQSDLNHRLRLTWVSSGVSELLPKQENLPKQMPPFISSW